MLFHCNAIARNIHINKYKNGLKWRFQQPHFMIIINSLQQTFAAHHVEIQSPRKEEKKTNTHTIHTATNPTL